ncbi:MAG: hypothetical protein IT373_08110 [Polyangiaceae bacterium]|nr:hypothetical protein [Polyangiaceae bacterium]
MAYYLVESYLYSVDHGGRSSRGVVGEHKGSEKLYLHVLPLSDAELAALGPRVDEDGNKQHDRLALPRNEDWWIAVEGEAAWPKVLRPRLTSRCADLARKPTPVPLSAEELGRLRASGVGDIPAA